MGRNAQDQYRAIREFKAIACQASERDQDRMGVPWKPFRKNLGRRLFQDFRTAENSIRGLFAFNRSTSEFWSNRTDPLLMSIVGISNGISPKDDYPKRISLGRDLCGKLLGEANSRAKSPRDRAAAIDRTPQRIDRQTNRLAIPLLGPDSIPIFRSLKAYDAFHQDIVSSP